MDKDKVSSFSEDEDNPIVNEPFLCQYIDPETGTMCLNTTFQKELITSYVKVREKDKFYKEIVVDIVLKCTKCGYLQVIEVVDDGGHSKGKIVVQENKHL